MNRAGMVIYHGIGGGADLREYGRIADDLGYDSLWVTERYLHEETASMLGYLAAATSRVKLGVGVVNPFTRHPALLAMMAATLDRISGGRFVLGMGRSDSFIIQERLGMSYSRSRTRLQEALTIVREFLEKGSASYQGRVFNQPEVSLEMKPIQDRLPIYMAAIGPKALKTAGALADGVLLNAYVSPGYVKYAVEIVRAASQEAGRDPNSVRIACMLVMRMTPHLDEVRSGLKQRLVRLYSEVHVGEILLETSGFDPGAATRIRELSANDDMDGAVRLVTDGMVDSCYVIGPPEQCRERVEEYARAGVDEPLLLPRLEDYRDVAEAMAG